MPGRHAAGRDAPRLQTESQYSKGHADATATSRNALEAVLKAEMAVDPLSGERLTYEQARQIFTGVFGVFEADQAFGPETLPLPLAELAKAQRRSARGAA